MNNDADQLVLDMKEYIDNLGSLISTYEEKMAAIHKAMDQDEIDLLEEEISAS